MAYQRPQELPAATKLGEVAAQADSNATRDAVMERDDDAEPQTAESLSPERVAELLRSGEAELIDVRQPDEWARGHIPGARHIVLEQVSARAGEIERDRMVIFHCAGGNRSAMAADAFRQAGYDAYNMSGGVRAWEQAGLPLEQAGLPLEAGGTSVSEG